MTSTIPTTKLDISSSTEPSKATLTQSEKSTFIGRLANLHADFHLLGSKAPWARATSCWDNGRFLDLSIQKALDNADDELLIADASPIDQAAIGELYVTTNRAGLLLMELIGHGINWSQRTIICDNLSYKFGAAWPFWLAFLVHASETFYLCRTATLRGGAALELRLGTTTRIWIGGYAGVCATGVAALKNAVDQVPISQQPTPSAENNSWYTVTEAATVAHCNPGQISRAADKGDLKNNGKTNSERRIDAVDLTRWILQRSKKPEQEESDGAVEAKLKKASVRPKN